MGRKIVLTGTTLTDDTLPRLSDIDPMESEGSLFLIEPNHPTEQWTAGVPTNGMTIPNLFNDNLTTLYGSAAVDPTITVEGGINNNTKGKIERSTKGGLHVIVSQANALSSGDGTKVTCPVALYGYMYNNPSHQFYFSVWDRLTRANDLTVTSNWAVTYEIGSSSTGATAFFMSAGSAVGSSGASGTVLYSDTLGNVVGPRFGVIASTSNALSATFTSKMVGPTLGAPASSIAAASLATRNGKWPSLVFYRMYAEDLTVSGRTYSEAAAIDSALYTQQVLTSGGRYYGDTTPTAVGSVP